MKVLHKYSGAGNSFLITDGRDGRTVEKDEIIRLCREHGTDGFIILGASLRCDFSMKFFNPDGSSGMMCGNGGRCIAAFARDLGLNSGSDEFLFEAPDRTHRARILSSDSSRSIITLKMKDVTDFRKLCIGAYSGYFIDTGARHFVTFVDDVEDVDVRAIGRQLRLAPQFSPSGANVNFVSTGDKYLNIRTFEKGVEDETLSCGTGITASAVAAWLHGIAPASTEGDRVTYNLKARIDMLSVSFTPVSSLHEEDDIWLTGPAEKLW